MTSVRQGKKIQGKELLWYVQQKKRELRRKTGEGEEGEGDNRMH